MSFVFDKNNLTNTTNKININDSIFVYPNKIIETDKFFSKENIVFDKNTPIPFAYIAHQSRDANVISTVTFDVKKGNIVNSNNATATVSIPAYYNQLISILFDNNVKCQFDYMWSSCASRLSDVAVERSLFLNFKGIDQSLYTKDTTQTNIQPIINIKQTAANNSVTISLANNQLSINNTLTSQLYTILMVKLL